MELLKEVYLLLKKYPLEERYALCDQMRRAAISIPSNLAEGSAKASLKDQIRFVEISYGSLLELMCQFEISQSLHYISDEEFHNMENLIENTGKLLSGYRNSLIKRLQ